MAKKKRVYGYPEEKEADRLLQNDRTKRRQEMLARAAVEGVLTDEQVRDGIKPTMRDIAVLNDLPHNPSQYDQPQIRLAALGLKFKHWGDQVTAKDEDRVVVTIKRATPELPAKEEVVDAEYNTQAGSNDGGGGAQS